MGPESAASEYHSSACSLGSRGRPLRGLVSSSVLGQPYGVPASESSFCLFNFPLHRCWKIQLRFIYDSMFDSGTGLPSILCSPGLVSVWARADQLQDYYGLKSLGVRQDRGSAPWPSESLSRLSLHGGRVEQVWTATLLSTILVLQWPVSIRLKCTDLLKNLLGKVLPCNSNRGTGSGLEMTSFGSGCQ